jgi:hypothetical protein
VDLLVSLRCVNNNKKFRLARNVDNVGDINNVVIKCELEEGVCRTFFVQLELRQDNATITGSELKQISGPVTLLNLFESYCLIRKGNGGILELCGSVDDLQFILYTNATVEYGAPVTLTDTDPLRALSSGSEGGLCTTFSGVTAIVQHLRELKLCKKLLLCDSDAIDYKTIFTSEEIRNNLQNETLFYKLMNCDFSLTGDFLQQLKILHRQSPVSGVEQSISTELEKYAENDPWITQQIRNTSIVGLTNPRQPNGSLEVHVCGKKQYWNVWHR